MQPKLEIEHQQNDRFILKVTANGKYWEVDIRMDPEQDGGIDVDISRDGILCTGCEFGWEDKHDNEPSPFMDYWNAVDAALLKFFGIDTADTGLTAEQIAEAQEEGWTPEDLVRWYGKKYDLKYLDDRKASAQAAARLSAIAKAEGGAA
jgi:hypothetical protein